MSDRLLGQEEIDALLSKDLVDENEAADEAADEVAWGLRSEEMDALGEIGNISMGSAATTLSQILNRRVSITSPEVKVVTRKQLLEGFGIPHLLIEVDYTQGLEGTSLLVMQTRDAAILADLMMGGDGLNPSQELTEIEISAASEAMNQMIGTASTSMATMFGRTVNIGPPAARIVTNRELDGQRPLDQDHLALINFHISVEGLIDDTLMQVLDLNTARAEAAMLWQGVESMTGAPEAPPAPEPEPGVDQWTPPAMSPPAPQPPPPAAPAPRAATDPAADGLPQHKLEMLLDIPLQVSVILGRSRQPVKDVLNLTPGAVVGLDVTVDEPVEILLNGTLVAKGEVVVVEENFGVRITSILSPVERLQNLRR